MQVLKQKSGNYGAAGVRNGGGGTVHQLSSTTLKWLQPLFQIHFEWLQLIHLNASYI